MAGKGSGRRRALVSDEQVQDNWDRIFKKTMNAVIYTGENCSVCTQAKEFCRQHGIAYVERDVLSLTPAEWKEAAGLVPRSVPQMFLNGEYVGGFAEFRTRILD